MSITKRTGRGKPPRYKGEKSTRLSVLVRPRYRQILELIAKDRDSTLSEAMEFAIVKLAESYILNGQPVINYFRANDELYEIIKDSFEYTFPANTKIDHLEEEKFRLRFKEFYSFYEEQKNIPEPLRSPFQNYCLEILDHVDAYIYIYFDWDSLLFSAFLEAWRTGVEKETVITIINQVISDYGITVPFDLHPFNTTSKGPLMPKL